MEPIYSCLDVGGTEIKAAPVDGRGNLCRPIRRFPSRAEESAEAILAHLTAILWELRCGEAAPAGIRFAFPGPFDYRRGICLMQGLAKYDKLYGVNLRRELSLRLNVPENTIGFANDAAAFALGEMGFGEAAGAGRAMFVCIGTGCGSAFGVEGFPAPEGTPGVPPEGYVYNHPFLDGCIDDYLSRRGLMELSRQMLGEPLDGKLLADRERRGDPRARECFLAFGRRIRDGLEIFLRDFRPETLCFGGQITRSGALFLPPVEALCRELGIRLYVTEDTSLRALQGLTRLTMEC